LPKVIYRKEYAPENRHLPKAVYTQDLEDELFTMAGLNQVDKVRALLNAGVPIEMRNAEAETPLLFAIRHEAGDVARMLLGRGADANAADSHGVYPIHYAVWLGREDIVLALLKNGADPVMPDPNGVTPLQLAQHQQNIALSEMLISATGGSQQALLGQ
jgi:ankyrin repeat protein